MESVPVVAHVQKDDGIRMPNIAAGYSDGTVRMFDLNRVEMILKMHPHAVAVTAISFSADGKCRPTISCIFSMGEVIARTDEVLICIFSPRANMFSMKIQYNSVE